MKAPRNWASHPSQTSLTSRSAAVQHAVALAAAWGLAVPFAHANPGPGVLITSVPPPPLALVAPNGPPVRATAHAGRAGALVLEWGTSAWVKNEQAKRFGAAATEGLALVRQTGQRGVLMQVRYTQTRNFVGSRVVSPVGEGVIVVGAGPDANATCRLQNCGHSLSPAPAMNAARTWTSDSGYYWLEFGREVPGGNPSRATGVPVSISRYDTEALQTRTLQLNLTEDGGYAYAQSVNAMVLQDFLTALKEDATAREDHVAIEALRAAQKSLHDHQVRIEDTLAKEFKRQADRGQAASMLALFGDAVSLAAAALTPDPNAQARAEQRMAALTQELSGVREQLGDVQNQVKALAQKHNKTVPRLLWLLPPRGMNPPREHPPVRSNPLR